MNDKEFKIYEKKIKLYEAYNDFSTKKGMGEYWVSFIKQFIVPAGIIATAASYQVVLWGLNWSIPFWILILFIIFKNYVVLAFNYTIGRMAERTGIWKYSNEYASKKEHLAPWQCETRATLEAICNKLGIKSEYKDL